MAQEKKRRTSFTLSEKEAELLKALAKHLGLSKTATIRFLLREAARERKLL